MVDSIFAFIASAHIFLESDLVKGLLLDSTLTTFSFSFLKTCTSLFLKNPLMGRWSFSMSVKSEDGYLQKFGVLSKMGSSRAYSLIKVILSITKLSLEANMLDSDVLLSGRSPS